MIKFIAVLALLSMHLVALAYDYRTAAANQIYAAQSDMVYSGCMPPLLYSVSVVQVTIDATGHVSEIRWLRQPPYEVAVKIETSILQLSLEPSDVGAVFVETWLWDKSNKFQLLLLADCQ